MAPHSAIHSCLVLCLLLVAPQLGSSYKTTSYYTHGGSRHVVLRDGALSVTHRLSPCSGADADQSMPTVSDTFNRDALRLRALSGSSSKQSDLTIPSTGTPLVALPGGSEYHVTVGYGTPVQKLTVGFDTATAGATLLQCKPCAAGAPCGKAFDPSRSSSLAQIPCGSHDCPLRACSGPTCTIAVTRKGTVLVNATFVTDTLTVAPSIPVNDIRVACLEMGARTTDSSSGVIDLSRESHSLASRVVLSPETVAFSYCLPWDPATQGFLTFGATRPERAGRGVTYAKLQRNAGRPNLYFVKLVGVSIGGIDLPVAPASIAADALVEVHTTFTYLKPDVYAVLRSNFRWWMKEYVVAPSSGELDTCYDFTHLNAIEVPIITLRFEGGASLELGIEQMMYFKDRRNIFSVACLAFAPAPAYVPAAAVIGSLVQSETEVVYDVLGGKLGLVPNRC
ncbi:aspartyl protease family protein At5g10770-like [Lolium perenne]|uniref:aspartyl protease family protein At5g10770-like n=1 Tax=Lolium perenne TaxID=4522 RepID=UPI003A98D7FE